MKTRAFVKYTKKGQIISGSLIITNGEYPSGGGLYQEVSTKWSESTTIYGTKKRAFVGYTEKGDIIAGSLVITNGTYPSGPSLWKEVSVNLETTTSTTTTSTSTTTTTIAPDLLCVIDDGWSLVNLNVTTYANGDPIPEVQDQSTWNGLTTGAWCSYDNNPANDAIYGKLYNWHAVNDPRGLAPVGYRIPSEVEWNRLIVCLGGDLIAGGKMKETGTTHWFTPNTGATNSSGFTGLPGGSRTSFFNSINFYGEFWSSLSITPTKALSFTLDSSSANIYQGAYDKYTGCSVRVIADTTSTTTTSTTTSTSTTSTTTTAPISPMCVTNAGNSYANGIYNYDGVINGRNTYRLNLDDGYINIAWLDFLPGWFFQESRSSTGGRNIYYSTDDVLTPDLVTTWTATIWGSLPTPMVYLNVCP